MNTTGCLFDTRSLSRGSMDAVLEKPEDGLDLLEDGSEQLCQTASWQ